MVVAVQETLRFPPVDGLTVRGAFDGGVLSSDIGPLLLCGVDRQIGLTERRIPKDRVYETSGLD